MTRAITHTYVLTYDFARHNRNQIVWTLIFTCILMAGLYAFSIYRVVSNTVALKALSTETRSLEEKVRALDAQYIAVSKNITPDALAAYGMVAPAVSAFIDRTPSFTRASGNSGI